MEQIEKIITEKLNSFRDSDLFKITKSYDTGKIFHDGTILYKGKDHLKKVLLMNINADKTQQKDSHIIYRVQCFNFYEECYIPVGGFEIT